MKRILIGAALTLALAATHADAAARAHKASPHAPQGVGLSIGKTAFPGHAKASSGHHFGAVLPTGNCNPNFVPGQVPPAATWNSAFNCAFPAAGGLLGGPLGLPASTTSTAPLNIAPGSAPTSPSNGDIWATSAGVFIQVNGSTVGPLGTGGGALAVGTTAISAGTNGDVEFNNAGVLGEFALGANVKTSLGVALNASGGINSPTPTRAGDIDIWNGTLWTTLAGNNSGTLCLQENASGSPSWAACGGAGLTVGTTTISGGSFGKIEFNNAGVLGELAVTPNATAGFPVIRRVTTGTTDGATTADSTIVIALGTPAAFAETLPACVSGINGQRIVVKDENGQAGTNAITVKATTSTVDTIAGTSGFIMNANFQSVGFQCDSAAASGNWMAE